MVTAETVATAYRRASDLLDEARWLCSEFYILSHTPDFSHATVSFGGEPMRPMTDVERRQFREQHVSGSRDRVAEFIARLIHGGERLRTVFCDVQNEALLVHPVAGDPVRGFGLSASTALELTWMLPNSLAFKAGGTSGKLPSILNCTLEPSIGETIARLLPALVEPWPDLSAFREWKEWQSDECDRIDLILMREQAHIFRNLGFDRRETNVTAGFTPGERRLWNALSNRALTAAEAAEVLDTSPQTITEHVQSIRLKRAEAIRNVRGYGYFRPDSPPDWSAATAKQRPRIRPT